MNQDIPQTVADATELAKSGNLLQATAQIQRALSLDEARRSPWLGAPVAVDLDPAGDVDAQRADRAARKFDGAADPRRPTLTRDPGRGGTFVDGYYEGPMERGAYKLFIPALRRAGKAPLIVLLHGCAQDPTDFAAGTGMNQRAERDGFFVLYPEQSSAASPNRCWNWFKREDQMRGRGEPALIAGMTQAIVDSHDIDTDRIYIAGLSAGGAMSAIVASQYPELFAAVGVHSGLPSGAASNLPDALAAMRTGTSRGRNAMVAGHDDASAPGKLSPTIVFHGDRDTTVHPGNGQRVVDAVLRAASDVVARVPIVSQGITDQGKKFTRSRHVTKGGEALAELWMVHEVAHAWSGGAPSGSYTDADGPSATDEMLRFFFEHRRRAH